MSRHIPHLTAVGSGKGGTGKTFVALSLAASFAARGERVLMCDADLGLANTTVQLGLPGGGDLPGLIAGRTAFKNAVVRNPCRLGFDLLAAPAGTGFLADASEKTAEELIAILLGASGYGRIVLDLNAGVGAFTMTLASHADDALAVTTPDPAALTDAYAFIKLMARRTGGRMPAVVVNRASGAAEAKRTAEALLRAAGNFLGRTPDYLGFVPEDGHVTEAIRHQTALSSLYPQCPAASAIDGLAAAFGSELSNLEAAPSLR
jgi:flagellar biosynthesis protein FlhG